MKKYSLSLFYLIAFFLGTTWAFIPTISNLILPYMTESEYGMLGLLLILGSICFSFSSGTLAQYLNSFKIFLTGIFLAFLANTLFCFAYFSPSPFLLFAIASFTLGSAIGIIVTNLNLLILHFVHEKRATAITFLYGCVSLGAASPPLFLYLFCSPWFKTTLFLSAIFLIFLLLFTLHPSFKHLAIKPESHLSLKHLISLWKEMPKKFHLFILAAFIYGIIETAYDTWGPVFLNHVKNLPLAEASLSITAFWSSVMLAQFLFAFLFYIFPFKYFYPFFPILMTLSLIFTNLANLPSHSLALFCLAGLATSAFFPLTIRLAAHHFPHLEGPLFGLLYSIYFIGIGLCSYALGLAQTRLHIPLKALFATLPLFAIALFFLSLLLLSKKTERSS